MKHKEGKEYGCTICNLLFVNQEEADEHTDTHNCYKCGKGFKSSGGRNRHNCGNGESRANSKREAMDWPEQWD
ncbi:hypothetical protein M422DRAFT_27207 [Sphaerobolus stellatus SS14]|nr:hypothetical protein M422DRAFT_27207 [Sphaerobolus stellatus SS14]